MKNNKNQAPIYVEKQIINEEREQLNVLKIIPQDFVELTTRGKNYMCSTENWKEPICERYGFAYENGKKWITLDVPQELMEKLGLERGENCSNLIFLSPEVLKREPECGGITLQNEKEIFLSLPGSKLGREKETQTKLNGKEFTELEKKLEEAETKSADLEKLKNIWRNKFLEEKESNGREFQEKIAELTRERDTIQQKLNNQQTETDNLQDEINRLNNTLQTDQQEKNQIQQNLKSSLLGSLFKNRQKKKSVNELNNSLAFLRGLLVDKKQQLFNLTTERNNLQTQVNDLNQKLNVANALIVNRSNEITELKRKIVRLETARDNRPNISFDQWNNDYSRRPTQQQLNAIQQEKNNLQTQLDNVRTELNNTKNERDDYRSRWVNHTCPPTSYSYQQHPRETNNKRRGDRGSGFTIF